MSKSEAKASKQDAQPEIRLVEADNPNGPWAEIPSDDIDAEVKPLDDARLENPILNWIVPVDLMTELYDAPMGTNTRLSSGQLRYLEDFFGKGFTLRDVRLWLDRQGLAD